MKTCNVRSMSNLDAGHRWVGIPHAQRVQENYGPSVPNSCSLVAMLNSALLRELLTCNVSVTGAMPKVLKVMRSLVFPVTCTSRAYSRYICPF